MDKKIPCSVLILTLNAEATLEQALESVKDFADILILDGNSTDRTQEIAQKFGARVFPQEDTREPNIRITDFSKVRNKGISLARYPWMLCIDRDEYLSAEAAEEIQHIVEDSRSTPSVYRLPRKYVLNGQLIERASVYPNYQNRFFHRDAVLGFVKPVHENLKRKPGVPLKDLSFPEYVPLDSVPVMKKKLQRYLDIQQEGLKNLTFVRLLKGLRSNSKKFISYSLKYFLTFFRGKGKRMPFWYEYYNATYHIRLLWRLCINYYRKIF